MTYPSSSVRRKDTARDGVIYKPTDKASPSPITPAVTGLCFPTPIESSPGSYDRGRPMQQRSVTTHSRTPTIPDLSFVTNQHSQSSEDDSVEPTTPIDYQSIDQLWGSIRQQKERKMAKEPSKIKSFEVPTTSLQEIPVLRPSPEPKHHTLKRRKSVVTYRETDAETMAIIDLPGVAKEDVHVSYQGNRLMVTWQVLEEFEVEEEGHLVRERKQKIHTRYINIPEGAKFQNVRAAMGARHLVLRCANPKAQRTVDISTVDEY